MQVAGQHMKCAFNVLAQLPNSQVNLQLHKMVKDTKTKTWSVTPDKDVVFVVKQLDTSKKEKPCDQNAGSYVKLASLHDSTKVVYYMRWRFLSRAVLATDSTPLTMCIVASEQPIGGAPCEPAGDVSTARRCPFQWTPQAAAGAQWCYFQRTPRTAAAHTVPLFLLGL